jgi:type II secretory pathway pseudopilin PulG
MRLPNSRAALAAGRQSAFTMVEIAICIAVVGFALVAILGVLPMGFDVQRRNRENTIINQEGQLWLEALRGGALGLDYLTNHVDAISVPATPVTGLRAFDGTNGFRTGREIIGLLTQPAVIDTNRAEQLYRRPVAAFVRALTGIASDKTPRNDFAFTYRLTTEVVPYRPFSRSDTNWNEGGLLEPQQRFRSNEWLRARAMRSTAFDVQVALEWPVYFMNGRAQVGDNRKVFRALVNGVVARTNDNRLGDLHWLRSSEQFQLLTP